MKRKILPLLLLAATLFSGLGLSACNVNFGKQSSHTHLASAGWVSDGTYHWHECTVRGCSEQLDKEEHTTEYAEGKTPSCTEEGIAEHWHCTVCGGDFTGERGGVAIGDVTLPAEGHSPVTKSDDATHWQECEVCLVLLTEAQPHEAISYHRNKSGHYKVCDECGIVFDEGAHTEGESCTVCGYDANIADRCASDYGYGYLGTLAGGTAYQNFYRKLDETASAFHDDGTKSASAVQVNGSTVYVAGEIGYDSLGLTLNQAISVWATYRYDHPLYYWISGQVVYNSKNLSVCVESDYRNGSERKEQNDAVYAAIDGYLREAEGETSPYRIAFAFHDGIIGNIDYARDDSGYPVSESWAHGILGVFTRGQAVCEGYAKAFSLLLNACGVENVYVSGTSKGEGHAWNIVKIGDGWYWYDLTWDDQPHIGKGVVYDYFCQPGELADHTVGETGNFNSSANFLYALPTPAEEGYATSSLEYGEEFTVGSFTYRVSGYGEAELVSSDAALAGEITLSAVVSCEERTYSLAEIGENAFRNNGKITKIFIPRTVAVINNFAFYGCALLTEATFEDPHGWKRTSADGTFTVSADSLSLPAEAVALLKETYRSGGNLYQYVWVKTLPAA